MKREREEQPYEALTFYSSPALHQSTWFRGIMDIVIEYQGQPFGFMVVRDGVWDAIRVYRDARCSHSTFHDNGFSFYPRIVAGCKAVIMNECPTILLPFTQQGAPAVKGLDQG